MREKNQEVKRVYLSFETDEIEGLTIAELMIVQLSVRFDSLIHLPC